MFINKLRWLSIWSMGCFYNYASNDSVALTISEDS